MYNPSHFALTDAAEIDALMRRMSLGVLVTHGPRGLFASHLPMIYDPGARILSGHLARANPHRDRDGGGEALVIFQGLDGYISPGWYPSKVEHGRVVPTWNYEAVHIYGRIAWRNEPEWLRANVEALTRRFEADRPQPWATGDAPEGFIDGMLRGIVGVELRIDRIEAKRKLSQNRTDADRLGAAGGLSETGSGEAVSLAEQMRRIY